MKTTNILRIICVLSEIRTSRLSNSGEKYYRLRQLAPSFSFANCSDMTFHKAMRSTVTTKRAALFVIYWLQMYITKTVQACLIK
jgi:hypothetical protein